MSLQDISIKREYRSLIDNVVKDFYIPLLKQSTLYRRGVGFFSSSALIEISKGIAGLVENGGKIQLVASPYLSEEDIEAIRTGYELRNRLIEQALIREMHNPKNDYERNRLNFLAHLIADGTLDIKIAFTENNGAIGMYHEKMGLISDEAGNKVAFSGSMNESATAMVINYETIDVFCSWDDEQDRVATKENAFTAIWNDSEPNIKIIDFPNLKDEFIQRYKRAPLEYNIDKRDFGPDIYANEPLAIYHIGPGIPSNIKLHNYQQEAIDEWQKHDFHGIFDMATGTGKTYTGLGAIARLYEHTGKNLAVFIVCPYQHLVEQWIEEIIKFNMKPIIGYSASSQKDWKKRLKDAVISFNLGVKNHFCFISTNATFSSDFVQEQLDKVKGNVGLMVDEAHNFGSENLSKTLKPSIPYRLALSATLERHGDEEGTSRLFSYFGEKCIEYTLKQAIDDGKLTPYYYYPLVVNLTKDELIEYKRITVQIFKHCSKEKNGKMKLSETGKMLLIKRARIVAAAQAKISILTNVMKEHKNESHMLIYCGAATLRDPGYIEGMADEEEKRQIDIVADMLGNNLSMRISKFTSEESADERKDLIAAFTEGKHLQALVAIRCLDEGVDIPSIKTAFILASSTNPKEYVQRRGRVLRKYPGKNHAVIYDFITLPISLDEVEGTTEEEIRMVSSLARREIKRMQDFATIAENPSVADQLINDITDAFNLYEKGGTEFDI